MDCFEVDVDRSTCVHSTSLRREMFTFDVNDVIYHKIAHGAASKSLNGENVNVMLK